MSDDVVEVEPIGDPTDADLGSIADLARAQVAVEAEIAALEARLKEARARLTALSCEALPRAMAAVGLSDLRLASGQRVEVRERYQCGQLDDAPDVDDKRRPLSERVEALSWLDEQGHGDIARRVITVSLGAKSEEIANDLLAMVRAHPAANQFLVDTRRAVPWNTLAKFAREQLEGGYDPPLDLLGVSVQTQAKITVTSKKEEF